MPAPRTRMILGACCLLIATSCGEAGGDTTSPAPPAGATEAPGAPEATTTTTPAPDTTAGTPTTSAAPPPTTAPPPTSSSTTMSPVTVTSSTVAATNPIFEITVTNGEVKGPGRVNVRLGDVFIVRVVADVADEVHVHGYDQFADVAPDMPAVIEVEAFIPGVFEIELEGSRLELLLVEVA